MFSERVSTTFINIYDNIVANFWNKHLHFEYRWCGGDAVPIPDSGSSDRPGGVTDDSVEDPQLMWWSVTESSVELQGVTASSSAEEQLPVSERSENHVKLEDLLQVGDVCVATSRWGPPSLCCRSNCWDIVQYYVVLQFQCFKNYVKLYVPIHSHIQSS